MILRIKINLTGIRRHAITWTIDSSVQNRTGSVNRP